MKIKLDGHNYRYAVEQIMLALFPEEKPEYSHEPVSGSDEFIVESRLRTCNMYAQVTTLIRRNREVSRGYARVKRDKLTGRLATDRLLQRIVKQSFFRAAADIIGTPPAWGSLTGIRPAKLAAAALETGVSRDATVKTLTREFYVSQERAQLCADAAQTSLMLKQTLEPRDIALYIGIPFCPSRCAYCSFVSNSVEKSFKLIEPFVKTLVGEIAAASEALRELGSRVISVYIGGGTPTALPDDALEAIMLELKTSIDLTRVREYTVEAGRPETITSRNLGIISRAGADRVCVNPQSMSAGVLAAIGRKHRPEDVFDAVRLVRQSKMALNMDLIAGLPGDTPEGFRQSLNTVLGFKPENLTVHTLSLKKGSRIMLEGTPVPDGGAVADMLGYASCILRDSGYRPYYVYRQKFTSGGFENTGWCLPGYEGVYNVCMMEELCTVVAFGAGGVTKLVSGQNHANGDSTVRIERVFNAKYPREYILSGDKIKGKMDKIREFMARDGV